MSDNQYTQSNTQSKFAVDYEVCINESVSPTGTLGPVLGAGDPEGAFMKVQRTSVGIGGGMTGVTGCTVLSTTDPFLAVETCFANVMVVDPGTNGTWTVEFGPPVHNADNTFSIPITTLSSSVATDLPVGSAIYVKVRFQNGKAGF